LFDSPTSLLGNMLLAFPCSRSFHALSFRAHARP
jgi:hypothetical protein